MKPWEETWRVVFDSYGGYDCMSGAYLVARGKWGRVCSVDVGGGSHEPDEEREAEAKLIAAAPDMARALLDVDGLLEDYLQAWEGGPDPSELRTKDVLGRIADALSKAGVPR
jgi:hypothetical protein